LLFLTKMVTGPVRPPPPHCQNFTLGSFFGLGQKPI
jgi:hypothetical protein